VDEPHVPHPIIRMLLDAGSMGDMISFVVCDLAQMNNARRFSDGEMESNAWTFLPSVFGALRYHANRDDEICQELHDVDNCFVQAISLLTRLKRASKLSQWR
jgi:hypothetical protein